MGDPYQKKLETAILTMKRDGMYNIVAGLRRKLSHSKKTLFRFTCVSLPSKVPSTSVKARTLGSLITIRKPTSQGMLPVSLFRVVL
jgi:hypothetical protein